MTLEADWVLVSEGGGCYTAVSARGLPFWLMAEVTNGFPTMRDFHLSSSQRVGLRGGPPDIRGPGSLGTGLTEIELDTIALAQIVDALTVDGAGVEEHFFPAGISNKAEPFVYSQRFNRSCHSVIRSCVVNEGGNTRGRAKRLLVAHLAGIATIIMVHQSGRFQLVTDRTAGQAGFRPESNSASQFDVYRTGALGGNADDRELVSRLTDDQGVHWFPFEAAHAKSAVFVTPGIGQRSPVAVHAVDLDPCIGNRQPPRGQRFEYRP